MSSQMQQPIAVVGIGCRFPGAANPEEYWKLIEGARTAISPLPDSRLDRSLYYHPEEKGRLGSSYTHLSGLVEETPFNHSRFPISSELLETYDSVHLRMLEVCCEAVQDAGMDDPLSGLRGSRTGVFIGNTSGSTLSADIVFGTLAPEVIDLLRDSKFADLPESLRERVMQETLHAVRSASPSRRADGGPHVEAHDVSQLVNRALGLDGPSVAIDAACASSLISVAQAVYALQSGSVDMAIAGGCSFSKWFALVLFSQAQSISGTGTRPFDKDADGLISSDGYAAIVLKPLQKAQADGDRILSVIRSLSVGSDGKGKSLWAPRREGQIHAVRKAYNEHVLPGSLQYIECHATSTQVGDATEISALMEAMQGAFPAGSRIPIGSVKGNIGHTLECAGLAGMIKTIQALRHEVIPPQPSINELNPEIAWNDIPFYVPTQPEPWPDVNAQGVRRAAVNAFGIGGLNSHFVIDDRPEPTRGAQVSVSSNGVSGRAFAEPRSAEPRTDDLVAVVGIGVIAPDAGSPDEFWSLVSSGRSAISDVTDDRWRADLYHRPEGGVHSSTSTKGGFIRGFEFDWKKHRVPPKQIASSNPLQYMLLDAADQAFMDAGLGEMKFARERVSVVVGTMFGGDFSCQMQIGLRLPYVQRELKNALLRSGIDEAQADDIVRRYREHALEVYPALKDETGSFTSSTLASRLTKTFDLMGGAWALDASDVSSLVTLQAASDLLLTGNSDMVLCAAGQRSMDITAFEQTSLEGTLATGRVVPPFHEGQLGNVPGEAVGVLLLKRLSDAERDGDRIRGVIRGISVSFDERCDGDSVSRNLNRLFPADAGAVSRIDAVECARTVSPKLDHAELDGLQKALGNQPAAVSLGTTASQFGHSLSASGMISVIKAVLELEHQTVVPTCGASQPAELIRGGGQRFTLPNALQPLGHQLPKGAGRILVSNIDPAGAIGHLVIEGAAERMNQPNVVTETVPELRQLKIGAQSVEELQRVVSAGELSATSVFHPADRVRLGLVTTGEADVQRKLAAMRGGLAAGQRRHILSDNGILVTEPGTQAPHVAVVFSGQGAQYSGMLKDWIPASPAVRDFIAEADAALAERNLPSFEFLTQDESAELGSHVLHTQLAVLLADLAAWAALREAGVDPQFITGHSYGEFPALVAAGAWDLRAALLATLHRTEAVEAAGVKNAAMLSTTADPKVVQALFAELHLPCDIACFNSPDQTIIAGRISDLDQLSESLKVGGYASRTIRVPMPYHSRLMKPAQEPLARALRDIPIQSPSIRFVSCGSLQPLDTPDEIRQGLVDQLAEPVQWQSLIETLIASDTGVIIESGPRQILTRLNRCIIGDRSVVHLAVDARPGHAAEQKSRIRLLLEMTSETPQTMPAASSDVVHQGEHHDEAPQSVPHAVATSASGNGRLPHSHSKENRFMTDSRSAGPGRITWVDATEARRARMRETAQAKFAEKTATPGRKREPDPVSAMQTPVPVAAPAASAQAAPPQPARIVSTAPAPVAASASTNGLHAQQKPVAAPASTEAAPLGDLSRDKLESFVLNYVVEQTGYPPELVELDADLEADLGIDSIRKAQLLGEITETFEIREAANFIHDLSLDDFPSLNSIIEFFLKVSNSPDAAPGAVATTAAAPAPSSAPVPVSAPVVPVAVVPAAATSSANRPAVSRDELQTFAVNYVVEQTGYPEELVEVDADLEADLGIDSIRKAQLLGEIAEQYQLTGLASRVTDLSLDDFPTLSSIVSFFETEIQSGQSGQAGVQQTPPPPAAPPPAVPQSPPAAHSNGQATKPLTPRKPLSVVPVPPEARQTAPVAALSAQPAQVQSESRMQTATATSTSSATATATANGPSREELIAFAVNYVVEQTGYPEELVEVDADLEADLGIDSIRKAQLLGEIAENYQMTHLAGNITDMSLDDFPTLEAIADFFFEAAGRTTEHGSDSVDSVPAATHSLNASVPQAAPTPEPAATLAPFERVAESGRIMQRYVLRAIPDALPDSEAATGSILTGHVCLLGDNPDARALAERLQVHGCSVDIIASTADADAAVAQFDICWDRQPIQHLIVMTSSQARPADWTVARDEQLLVPYFVIQRWVQRRVETSGKATPPAGILAAITRLGGDFGISGRIGNVTGAALAGLLKGIRREHPELVAKVVDAPADEPSRLVIDAFCREVESSNPDVEAGVIRGQRQRLQMVPQPASGITTKTADLAGAWVVTGGARGITARIAAALGRAPGVRLHLAGRSPEPTIDPAWLSLDDAGMDALKKDIMRQAAADGKKPIDAWNSTGKKIELAQSLHALRSQGLDITYHACDVSDRGAVANLLDAVRQQHGSITGIIHGAGIEAAARFDRKKAESVLATVTSKVDGARWLWELTASDDLRFFVGFGSTSGRFGGLGQTDYSMSSDLLCRMGWEFAAERPNCRAFGIHWPPWDEIGMAARPESRFALESAGLKFVPPNEGISFLLEELELDATDGEVAIVDRVWDVPQEETDRDARLQQHAHAVAAHVKASAFVDAVIDITADSLTTEKVFDADRDALLSDHLVDGVPVVPGTVLLELCQQTAALIDLDRAVTGVRSFEILNGVRCRSGRQRLTTRAIRESDGVIRCEVSGAFCDQKNRVVDPGRVYVTAVILTGNAPSVGADDPVALPAEWETLVPATNPQQVDPLQCGTVYHGPSLARVRGIADATASRAWFRFSDPDGLHTPPGTDRPAILDAILQATDILLHRTRGSRQLPVGFGELDLHLTNLAGQHELAALIELTGEDGDVTIWQARCFDPTGRAVATMKNIRMRAMKGTAATAAAGALQRNGVASLAVFSPVQKILRPFLTRAGVEVSGDTSVVSIPVSPTDDRFLSEHTLHGTPILPAVIAVEMMAEAAESLARPGERTIAIRGMQIHRGIKCPGGHPKTLVLRCERSGDSVAVRMFDSETNENMSMESTVVLGTQTLPMEAIMPEAHGEFTDFPYPRDAPVQHGPVFRTLKAVAPWRYQGTARLQHEAEHLADDFPADAEWIIDPAILDGIFVACGVDAWLYYGNVPELPDSFEEMIIGRVPPRGEQCLASFSCRTQIKAETTSYDVLFQDSSKKTFLQVKGFSCRRLMPGRPGLLIVAGH